jgi:hypothetical protein
MVLLAGDVTREIPVLPRRWPFWLLFVIPPALLLPWLLLRQMQKGAHANSRAKIPDSDSSQPQGNRHSHVPPNP